MKPKMAAIVRRGKISTNLKRLYSENSTIFGFFINCLITFSRLAQL